MNLIVDRKQLKLCIKVFQDKSGIHVFIDPDRTMFPVVDIAHLIIEFRRRLPFPLAAVFKQDETDGRRIAQTAIFCRADMPLIVKLDDVIRQIIAQLASWRDTHQQFRQGNGHHAIYVPRYLP